MSSQQSLFGERPQPSRLSRTAANERAEDGMNRARKHAEKITKSWRLLGMVALEKFLAERRWEPFLAEQFVDWCKKNEVPLPPDGRAWGSVIASARRLKIIVKVGWGAAATSNLSPKPLWQAVEVQ